MSNPVIPEREARELAAKIARQCDPGGGSFDVSRCEAVLKPTFIRLAAAEARNRELEAERAAAHAAAMQWHQTWLLFIGKDYDKESWLAEYVRVLELREQRDKLRATLIAVGRNLGGQISEQASDGFLEHLAEESRLMAQKLAEESHAAKQFSEAVVRLTEQRDKLRELLESAVNGFYLGWDDTEWIERALAAIKATALPGTQSEEGEK